MSDLKSKVLFVLASALADVVDSVFALVEGGGDEIPTIEEAIAGLEFEDFLDEIMEPEVEQPVAPKVNLWDNPPVQNASWPNIPEVAKPTWPNVASEATVPSVANPVGAAQTISSWPHAGSPATRSGSPVAVAPPAPPTAPTRAQSVLRETVSRDERDRACVPNSISKFVGMKPLDFVFISQRQGGGGLMLLRKATTSGHLSTYKVDKDGNIRLSDYILRQGGLGSATRIKFRTTNDARGIVVVAG